MNKTIPLVIKTELNGLKSEINALRSMLAKALIFMQKNNSKSTDVSRDDLMKNASKVFDVTSKKTLDDDNVANPKKIKPVDFSTYV